jgi:hypothetical protein
MPAIAIAADRFGCSEFEVEGRCLVGGRGRYGAVTATCGSRSRRILDYGDYLVVVPEYELFGSGNIRACLLE